MVLPEATGEVDVDNAEKVTTIVVRNTINQIRISDNDCLQMLTKT